MASRYRKDKLYVGAGIRLSVEDTVEELASVLSTDDNLLLIEQVNEVENDWAFTRQVYDRFKELLDEAPEGFRP